MPTYYLRMEGVNLDSVLSDTNQISVIRGASLLLREATHRIEEKFAFTKISSGASIGLFQFDAPDQDAAEKIRKEVEKYLSQDEQLRYFTFVVDIQAESGDFVQDKEALIARNRFRQLQQPTFAFPTTATDKPCALTNLPASQREKIGEEIQNVSDSVSVRLNYGRKQKHEFYQQETKIKLEFTDSLKELAEPDANTPKNLGHKIAVLYLDGNGFSKIQEKHCKNVQDLQKFDEQVQTKRREFLTKFLKKICSDPLFFNHDEVRLETLLWGGDEMLFVVPAWKGLELLNYFYQVSRNWEFNGEKLTHAGGLVFCRAKTPIRRIRKFAQELADAVKNSKSGREENLFDYMVLESIDYPSEPLDELRKKIFARDELRKTYTPLQPLNDNRLAAFAKLKEIVNDDRLTALAKLKEIVNDDRLTALVELKEIVNDNRLSALAEELKEIVNDNRLTAFAELKKIVNDNRLTAFAELKKIVNDNQLTALLTAFAELKEIVNDDRLTALLTALAELKEIVNDDRLSALVELKENVPKSQAYNLVRAMMQGDKQCEEKLNRLKVVITDELYFKALDNLEQAFPQQTFEWQWIHLIELWDYILPTASQV